MDNSQKEKYNPWEDQKTFIQDVGSFNDLISFLSYNNITSNSDPLANSFQNENEYNSSLSTLDLFTTLDKLTTLQYEKLSQLEIQYEKYKYEAMLSRNKKNDLLTKVQELADTFSLFEKNKIKLVNLIHNASLSDNSVIKIKHSKKFELINILKICSSEYSSLINLIELSSEMHQETINKIVSLLFIVYSQLEKEK